MNRRTHSWIASTICIALLLSANYGACATLIDNGGFETGDFTGWNASGNVSAAAASNVCCQPFEGQHFANYNGGNQPPNGFITQDFASVPGTTYDLEFAFAKSGTRTGTAALRVSAMGVASLLDETVSDTIGGSPGPYETFQFSFEADSASTTLRFEDASSGTVNFDASLDSVSVVVMGVLLGDANFDNVVDGDDIDLMREAILNLTSDPIFNVDGIGSDIPDEADFNFLIEDIIGTGHGDGDVNKLINFADFVLVTNNFGQIGTLWKEGNFNLDDVTNFNDFVLLTNNFGMGFPSAEQQIPEPIALSFLFLGTLATMLRR